MQEGKNLTRSIILTGTGGLNLQLVRDKSLLASEFSFLHFIYFLIF